MIGKAIYNLCTSMSGLTALVGQRFYPVVMPEGTQMPCLVWRIRGNPAYTKSGVGHEETDVDFRIFAGEYDDAIDIFLALRSGLEDIRGVYNGVTVSGGRITNFFDDYDREAAAFFFEVTINFKHS